MVPENLTLDQFPGDDVRDHHHPTRLALPRDALPQVGQTFDPNR